VSELDVATIAELGELHQRARRVRGPTPADHPDRQASAELSRRLAELRSEGVPLGVLAQTLGVTPTGVNMRLKRHGHQPRSKSTEQIPVFGSVRWKPPPASWIDGRCQRGHDITDPQNVGTFSGGIRYCLGCYRLRHRPRLRGHNPEAMSMREWARAQGIAVNDRGPVPRHVRDLYEAR
jgi:hypothetical protein